MRRRERHKKAARATCFSLFLCIKCSCQFSQSQERSLSQEPPAEASSLALKAAAHCSTLISFLHLNFYSLITAHHCLPPFSCLASSYSLGWTHVCNCLSCPARWLWVTCHVTTEYRSKQLLQVSHWIQQPLALQSPSCIGLPQSADSSYRNAYLPEFWRRKKACMPRSYTSPKLCQQPDGPSDTQG